ncbi:hypothetical protein SLEP1_g50411 [Rubroshorea leprosula]|uniref:Uncharacterized protein n=1 Tax=Rubroshorea leprosula TaxID=152421 RepID=A0AAV5LZX0_9ROSI|nr:hypothetical protein SLEP1_g50411 [Rubroshorea leprosula]
MGEIPVAFEHVLSLVEAFPIVLPVSIEIECSVLCE